MKRYPKAIQNPQPGDGGSMVGGPPRAVLHTTETPRTSSAYPYYHILFKDLGDVVHIEQLRPFERASRALRNLDGGVQTNRQGDVNINAVIIGYARDSDSLSDRMYDALNKFAIWVKDEYGVPLEHSAPKGAGNCYGYTSRCRLSKADWIIYEGWCGHQNVPENTHWDPGLVDWDRILKEGEDMPSIEEIEALLDEKLRIVEIDGKPISLLAVDSVWNVFHGGRLMKDNLVNARQAAEQQAEDHTVQVDVNVTQD